MAELEKHLALGVSLGEALRFLHFEKRLGLMYLWPAVMVVMKLDKREAMKVVVHEVQLGRDSL